MLLAFFSISCNNSNASKENADQKVKSEINLDEERTKLETSMFGFKAALEKEDAKNKANN